MLILVVAGAAFLGVMWRQAHTEAGRAEDEAWTPSAAKDAAADSGASPPGAPARLRVVLDISLADVVVMPAPAGQPARVDARFDPNRFELTQEAEKTGEASETLRVTFGPIGSKALALLRLKLGGEISHLRIALPVDSVVELQGRFSGTYSAMELGGLALQTTDLNLDNGAVSLSFASPLQAPMEHMSIFGHRGSVEVTTLGNASPAEARFDQGVGALDLDLRGAWSRDAKIFIDGRIAGGSIWLPRNVAIEGLDPARFRPPSELAEGGPTLDLAVTSQLGQLIIVE